MGVSMIGANIIVCIILLIYKIHYSWKKYWGIIHTDPYNMVHSIDSTYNIPIVTRIIIIYTIKNYTAGW